jgi:phosphate-selective porin OprO/OprP
MNFKLSNLVAATLAGSMLMGFGANAMADSTTDIVNALVSKGVLTEEEGALLTKGRTGETEAAEAKKKTAVSGKSKNGISWESGDGNNSIALAGRVQLDYRTFDNNIASSVENFDVRRAYFGVSGKIAEFYDYKVVLNLAETDKLLGKSNQLDEAYFGINWWKEASFRFGQFKMPFSLEEQTSSRFTDFQERSLANKLIPGKEIGAMVHGTPTKGMFYAAALSTGEGRSNIEATVNEGNEFIGRVGFNFAEMMENKDNVYHAAIGYTKGKNSVAPVIEVNSEARGATLAKITLPAAGQDRTRVGLEGAVAVGPVKLQAEYIRATYDHSTKGDLDVDAWYASASWILTGEKYASSYKGGKFDRLSPTKDFDPKTFTGGAWEIGARYSDFSAKDFRDAGLVGSTVAAQQDSWTVGLKFIPTPNTRILMNYVDTTFDKAISTQTSEKAVTMRAQMDF